MTVRHGKNGTIPQKMLDVFSSFLTERALFTTIREKSTNVVFYWIISIKIYSIYNNIFRAASMKLYTHLAAKVLSILKIL